MCITSKQQAGHVEYDKAGAGPRDRAGLIYLVFFAMGGKPNRVVEAV